MQRTALQSGRAAQCVAPSRRPTPFSAASRTQRVLCAAVAPANGNGSANGAHANGNGHAKFPSPAQTIRTIVDIVNEGTLSTLGPNGQPIGIPVTFTTDKAGKLQLQMDKAALDMSSITPDCQCSLTVQAITQPARAVAAVTLVGRVAGVPDAMTPLPLDVEKCLYFGGLDQAFRGQTVSIEEYLAAEPDVLRKAAPDLVNSWNSERAEDIYRIVSDFQGVPLTEMGYAELLWVDHLGMYIRTEVTGREPAVVRVPFYRPVLDERDARSVITMAAQIAWERERSYSPPIPGIFADVAAASNN